MGATAFLRRVMGVIAAASLGWAGGPAHAEPVSLESLLREMTDREALARFPDPAYTARQFSSYDRASVSPAEPGTWFANNDFSQFLRVDEVGLPDGTVRREWVMADMAGPGAVVRIWSANPKGVMRVYLDGEARPVIEAPMQEVLGGTWKLGDQVIGPPLAQESARGFNLYLPIPYAKHCKITSDSDGFYYQVNYRTYSASAVVESLTLPLRHNGWLEAIQHLGSGMRRLAPDFERTSQFAGPGMSETLTISAAEVLGQGLEGARPAAIERFAISRPECADPTAALRQIVLSIDFDGERCVRVPLSDFFGSGVGINPFDDIYRTVRLDEQAFDNREVAGTEVAKLGPIVIDAFMTSRWMMPFQRECRIWIEYLGTQPLKVKWCAFVRPWSWDSRSMYFHAAWRGEFPIHALGGRGTMDWNYVDIQGKGVYVGDNLAVMNPVPEWWGEGDEKIYVDGEVFPSHFGTGTEDYYGYAWCSPQLFQHPFHAQVRCDGGKNSWGHTSVTRVRALDAIPFQKSLKFDMEVWHWKECDVAYAATMYWYARPGSTSNRLTDEAIAAMTAELKKPIPQPPPLPPPFKIEGAIECEGMKVLAKSDGLNVVGQDMDGFARGTWSGDAQLWVQGRGPGDFIELEIPAPPADGIDPKHIGYLVKLHATESWDYGIVRFFVNGDPAGSRDLFSGGRGQVRATGPIDLKTVRPVNGRLKLRVEVMGGNRAAEGTRSFFGLDCVTLEPRNLAPQS